MIITIDKIENLSGTGAGVYSKAAKAIGSITNLSYPYLMSSGVRIKYWLECSY